MVLVVQCDDYEGLSESSNSGGHVETEQKESDTTYRRPIGDTNGPQSQEIPGD